MKKLLLILLCLPMIGLGQQAWEKTFDVNGGDYGYAVNKKLIKITDVLGREIKQTNQLLFYIYDDGTVEKKIIVE